MKQLLFSILVAGTTLFSTGQAQAQCYSAVQLDGVNDYLHSPFSNYALSNFTIEMWINSADYLTNDVYVTINQSSYLILGGWQPDGSFNTWSDGLNPFTINSGTGTAPATGSWHHVAYVFDGTDQIIYIDGVPSATVATTGSVTENNGNNFGLTIGARFDQTQQFTNTTFEDVRIWQVARTQAEITATYSTNLTGSEPGLIAYYRFEEGAGSTTVADLSGNGNDLTLYNTDPATVWTSGLFSQDSQGTDVVSNCGPYTWIDGNTYPIDNNTATHTIVGGAAGGCDSIVTLDLTINAPVDNSLTTTSSPTISSNDASAGVAYQWIDCGNGNVQISGETNQDFTATTTGSYAVIVTGANGCKDTSACFAVDFTSLDESSLISGIRISPNPTNGEFSISTLTYTGELNLEVMDLTGKLIYKSTEILAPNTSAYIDLTNAAKGVYIVHVSSMTESQSLRVVKK